MSKNNLSLIRRLIIALTISATFNVGLTTFFAYWMIKERPPTPYCEHLPMVSDIRSQKYQLNPKMFTVFNHFQFLTMEELINKLSSKEEIDGQLTERDVALTFLTAFHHFDIIRALPSKNPLHYQKITLPRNVENQSLELPIYTNLSDLDFNAIRKFAGTEQWPITPYGMFTRLQMDEHAAMLKEAFYHTPYFIAVERLFNRKEEPMSRLELLQLILEGNWDLLSSFYNEQRILLDLSPQRLQDFLIAYLNAGSKSARKLLYKDDEQQEKLYTPESKVNPSPSQAKTYIVRDGDSLWKIAKNHQISWKKLMEANKIDESVFLQPGMELVIP